MEIAKVWPGIMILSVIGLTAMVLGGRAAGEPQGRATSQPGSRPSSAESRIPVTFTGGFETDPRDRGRPVVLIAAALKVPEEVFRKAFSNVRPAPGGQEPDPQQVRRNKEALLRALAPYGVTNDRLDEVSNYYRYNRGRGEMWRHSPAAAYATVRDGVISGFVITDPGSGYSSPPTVSTPKIPDLKLKVTLSFGGDFERNGSVKEIISVPGER